MNIEGLLTEMVNREASDCHLKVGRPPLFRIAGELLPTEFPQVDRASVLSELQRIMDPRVYQAFETDMDADFSHGIPGYGRYRFNAYHQRGEVGVVIRHIPETVPTIDAMGLPSVLKDLVQKPQGLVLVTGPTGSGKSTSLAAMIQEINHSRAVHIMTVEDPIEFVYSDERACINQRQLGTDTPSLKEALRRVLRQDPDIILMGEMRDKETIEMALHAAETGHLVFSTLHTNDAKQSVDRVIDSFPTEQHTQLFKVLSLCLVGVISQRLCKRADGHGRIAAMEIMINSPQVQALLEEGRTMDIEKAISTSGDYYRMQTFNQSLAGLVTQRLISAEEAMSKSSNPDDLRLLLRGVVGSGGGRGAADTGFRPSDAPKQREVAAPDAPAPAPAAKPDEPKRPKISRGFQF
ncbi:MAG: type IV pilus twitching motility protein PilT [Planctomycetota bacterium]|jgi:twitching motility protein PilT